MEDNSLSRALGARLPGRARSRRRAASQLCLLGCVLVMGCGSDGKSASGISHGPDAGAASGGKSSAAAGGGGALAASGGAGGAGGATGGASDMSTGGNLDASAPSAGGASSTGGNRGDAGSLPDAGAGGGPLVKEGGAPDPGLPSNDCPHTRVTIGSKGLLATGPTSAFSTAYGAAVSSTAAGPFVVDLTTNLSDMSEYSRAAFVSAAAATLSSGAVLATETAEMYYARSLDSTFQLGPLFKPFHLILDGKSVLAAGLELHGTIDGTCTFVPGASATLYISDSQAGVSLGGSTLGALLGAKNHDVTGGAGTNNGWAIPLAGDAVAVRLP